jgi:hypothetical protein
MRSPFIAALGLFLTPVAFAQEKPADSDQNTADPAVKPDAPSPEIPNPAEDVRTYAGVGSKIAYSEVGVAEAGGSLSFSTSQGTIAFSADPTIGYFLFDNVVLSGTVGIRHISLEGENSNVFSLVAEPSLHFPINDGLFWFGGIGLGAALTDTSQTDSNVGFAFAPRTGIQILLGRSGLLNLGARYSAVFSNVDATVTPAGGETVVAFVNTFDIQAGYTVMF